MFEGCIVALVTPFDASGKIDMPALERLAQTQLDSGADGIVVAGCTGESFTLTDSERFEMFKILRGIVGGRMKLIMGTGSSSTEVAVSRTRAAIQAGADGALAITPYGNKPSQSALIEYFSALARLGLPIILYNVPGRTGTTIAPETAVRLSEIDNIVAIKEASGSLDAVSHILSNSNLTVLSGDDSLTVPMMAIGARGVIATTANLFPKDFAEMVHSAQRGNWPRAGELHRRLFPIMKALFIEGNPVPLKAAMAHLGLIPREDCRPPLSTLAPELREKLLSAVKAYGASI